MDTNERKQDRQVISFPWKDDLAFEVTTGSTFGIHFGDHLVLRHS